MTRDELYISELNRIKDGANDAMVESIIGMFKECRTEELIGNSINMIESIRGDREPGEFLESVSELVVKCAATDESVKAGLLAGLDAYKEFLIAR